MDGGSTTTLKYIIQTFGVSIQKTYSWEGLDELLLSNEFMGVTSKSDAYDSASFNGTQLSTVTDTPGSQLFSGQATLREGYTDDESLVAGSLNAVTLST